MSDLVPNTILNRQFSFEKEPCKTVKNRAMYKNRALCQNRALYERDSLMSLHERSGIKDRSKRLSMKGVFKLASKN